jgi:myo-inositol-1(or 4)-monophosphatase
VDADGWDDDDLLALAVEAAGRAAALLVDGLDRRRAIETKSSTTDLVTEMDRASERLIVEHLLAARPDDGVLGEEGGARPATSGIRWVIDPIDGTTNYVYRHPGFAVSIAAQQVDDDGAVLRTAAGVVSDPLHGQVFTATDGGGARCNGEPIRTSDADALGPALVATGFAYDPDRRRRQAGVLTGVLPVVRDIRRMGAAAVDLCSVACGRVDAYFEKGLGPWDLAAGELIAREAGARVGDLHGAGPSGAFVLAAAPQLFEPLAELLRSVRADEV